MTQDGSAYFGNARQQAVQARAEMIWTLLQDDPRFGTHGRSVGLTVTSDDTLTELLALVRLQGVSSLDGLSDDQFARYATALEAEGIVIDSYVIWSVGQAGLDAARTVLAAQQLADDLTVVEIGPDSPDDDLQRLDLLTQSCDVLLPMASFVRGRQRPSTCLMAVDRAGQVVGCSASVAQFHPDHPKARDVWWGMLATHPDRRGEGIALILGAMLMQAMHRKFGYASFWTGIRDGNAPSQTLCRKLGLAATPERVLIAIDPAAMAGGQYTK